MMKKIDELRILDCTIRDGGYLTNWFFDDNFVMNLIKCLKKSKIDIIEIGWRGTEKYFSKEKYGKWRFSSEDDVRMAFGKEISIDSPQISIMCNYGKIDLHDFIPKNESLIDIVRVVADKEKITNAVDLLQKLKKKGYIVSLNATGFSNYSPNERIELVHILKESCIDILYIADTYGSLLPSDINIIFEPFLENMNNKLIGFHPHNNMQMAFINSIEAIKLGVDLIDATIFGMGRCAGNLPLELLLTYFKRDKKTKYELLPILIFLHQYMLPLHEKIGWGYTLTNLLSGFFKCHPYFIRDIIESNNKFEIDDIVNILVKINKINPPTYTKGMVDDIIKFDRIL